MRIKLWQTLYPQNFLETSSNSSTIAISHHCKSHIHTMAVDYSVYLVTDSTLVPEGRTFLQQVSESIDNGATIVQLREKDIDTRAFIKRAEQVHELTKKAGIPLIINDRVDVALAIDAEGIHVGQDDMPVEIVRKLIGNDKILGLSVSSVDEARGAIASAVVDYVGIGALYATNTKKLKKLPIGISGTREILEVLRDEGGKDIETVVIGGVNAKNTSTVLYTGSIPGKKIDGIAVVSDIIASMDAGAATKHLAGLVKPFKSSLFPISNLNGLKPCSKIIDNVKTIQPMTHQITNNVVKNFSANVTLAVSASPIMAEDTSSFAELAAFENSVLLLNSGTTHFLETYAAAAQAYNLAGKPIVFDPVGAGASASRKQLTKDILNSGYYTVIKGNEGEIFTAAGEDITMKGVDSVSTTAISAVVKVAKKLARDSRSIVVVTGVQDIIVEGHLNGEYHREVETPQRVVIVKGGHPLMGKVTGSGCSLGSVIAAYLGANFKDPFNAVVTAVALYKEAGGKAGKAAESKGPGSFLSHFLDELYRTTTDNKPESWTVKVEEYTE